MYNLSQVVDERPFFLNNEAWRFIRITSVVEAKGGGLNLCLVYLDARRQQGGCGESEDELGDP